MDGGSEFKQPIGIELAAVAADDWLKQTVLYRRVVNFT